MTLVARVMSPVWLLMWATLLSWSWLVPNHYRPWPSFHADALAAMAMAVGCAAVLVRSAAAVEWNRVTLMLAALVLVPLLQLGAGLLPFAGQAWMSTAYLLGLLLTVLAGQSWERTNAGQCADALFIAIGIGCIVSVGLQLLTWLGLQSHGVEDIWSMGLVGERAYANIGQPNQLATLLLWGILAATWGYQNDRIAAPVAILMVAFLLFGVAMTLSRTAWAGLVFLLVVTWVWRTRWKSRLLPWAALLLFALFWVYPVVLKSLSEFLFSGPQPNYLRIQFQDETRFRALIFFTKAVLASPWFGYGWTEVAAAQMAVADDLPGLGSTFGHSHNLFLDLVLWLGLPLGLLVSFSVIASFVTYVRSIKSANHLILVMFLGVIGIHAMLELPLHYAYFLLPTGMVVGTLNVRSGIRPIWFSKRRYLAVLWLAGVMLYAGIVRDYFLVEGSEQVLRFERAGFHRLPVGKPPEVLLLTQLREQIRFMRYDFQPGMSADDIQWAKDVANMYPGPATIYKVASALALNDRPQEARQWLRKGCKVTTDDICDLMRQAWAQDAAGNRRIATVAWPD
ncbi:MAG: Wzy polymerase domain-containing protein [Betaproteobacteria bacterium]